MSDDKIRFAITGMLAFIARQPAHMMKDHIGIVQLLAEGRVEGALSPARRALIQMIRIHPRHSLGSFRREFLFSSIVWAILGKTTTVAPEKTPLISGAERARSIKEHEGPPRMLPRYRFSPAQKEEDRKSNKTPYETQDVV